MNTTPRRVIATAAAAALVAGGAATAVAVTASPASADIERRGACGVGVHEFTVDREGRGFDASVDLDRLPLGSTWRVKLRHDGRLIANVVRTADDEGELDLERFSANTPGADRFTFSATRIGGTGGCSGTITTR